MLEEITFLFSMWSFYFLCPNEMLAYHLPQFGIVHWCKSWLLSGASFESRPLSKQGKNASWCFIHGAPPLALLLTKPQMTHWFLQTKQIARSGALRCDSEENSSLSSYIVVHEQPHFIFSLASVTVTCVKWAPSPASGARALAGPDTCPRSAVPATLDRTWLINRPVLITGTPLTGVAVTWIPRWGDSKSRGKCNGFCKIATH